MTGNPRFRTSFRFGPFELSLEAGELRKHGTRIRLQQKPFQALTLLAGRPGALLTREELQRQLWDSDTFVEFDDSLNHVIKRLRDALGDSAERPRFVETVPGQGYRFIAPVETIQPQPASSEPSSVAGMGERPAIAQAPEPLPRRRTRPLSMAAATLIVAAVLAGLVFWVSKQTPTTSSSVSTPVTKPVVAVLPLADLSEGSGESYFALAMTDELIGQLAKIGGLRVISRTSTMRFEDSDKSLPEIAQQLGATHVLEGSVLRTGGRARITTQLINASDDQHVWSDTYTRDVDDVIGLHSEVARNIARAIQVELTPDEELRLAAAHPVKPEAYQTYLKARSLFQQGNTHEAVEYFQRTIELDPDYAPAYSWLADIYIIHGWWSGPPVEILPKAKLAALKARELDNSLAEPHLLLAKIRAFYEWEWEDAEKHYQRALERNPNHARAYLGYGTYLTVLGRPDEAVEMAQRAVDLDPLSASTMGTAGDIYYFVDDYEQAIHHYRAARDIQPAGAIWHAMLGCVYTDSGRYAEVLENLRRSIPLAGVDMRPQSILAWCYARSGDRGAARKILDELERVGTPENSSHYSRAFVYASVGETDRAFALLDQAVQERWGFLGTITVIPPYDAIRSDPRYAVLMGKIGLEPRETEQVTR